MNNELQDLAWSVLPKEFKKEVKELYTKFCNEEPHSDCSYGYLGLLIKLFGSKCLPDAPANESANGSANGRQVKKLDISKLKHTIYMDETGWYRIEKNEQGTIIKEGIPSGEIESYTEPKYHVGQKIKFKGKDYGFEITAIEKWDDCDEYMYKLAGWKHSYRESDLEPYTEPTKHIADADKMIDKRPNRDLCDKLIQRGSKNHNRLHIAAMAMQGLLNATSVERFTLRISPEAIAKAAFEYADALIAESEKGGEP